MKLLEGRDKNGPERGARTGTATFFRLYHWIYNLPTFFAWSPPCSHDGCSRAGQKLALQGVGVPAAQQRKPVQQASE